jgi:hypothetical protein
MFAADVSARCLMMIIGVGSGWLAEANKAPQC